MSKLPRVSRRTGASSRFLSVVFGLSVCSKLLGPAVFSSDQHGHYAANDQHKNGRAERRQPYSLINARQHKTTITRYRHIIMAKKQWMNMCNLLWQPILFHSAQCGKSKKSVNLYSTFSEDFECAEYISSIFRKMCLQLMPKNVEAQCWSQTLPGSKFRVDGPATAKHWWPKLFRYNGMIQLPLTGRLQMLTTSNVCG